MQKLKKMNLFTKFAQPLSKWWQALRDEVTVLPLDDPFEPIMSVNKDILTLRTGIHNRRNTVLVPGLIAMTVVSFYAYSELWPNLKYYKNFANEMLEKVETSRVLKARTGYSPMGDLEEAERYYRAYLNEDGNTTIVTYLNAQSLEGNFGHELGGLIFLAVYLSATLSLWVLFLFKPRDADIYFDRRRRIVYTWRHGRVGAAYFENIGILENRMGLDIYLQFENPKKPGGFWPMPIVGIDAGKLVFHGDKDFIYLLAQLVAFMDHGKSVVIIGDSFQREPAKFFLFKDKQPENFEQRLAAVLAADATLVETYQTHVIRGHAI